jgi:hypothetical protein
MLCATVVESWNFSTNLVNILHIEFVENLSDSTKADDRSQTDTSSIEGILFLLPKEHIKCKESTRYRIIDYSATES